MLDLQERDELAAEGYQFYGKEEPELAEEDAVPNFEKLLARFMAKVNVIPQECQEAMGWLYVYRQIQDQRKRLANRANQMAEGKRVFWSHILSSDLLTPMAMVISGTIEPLEKAEGTAGARLHKALRHTSWYQQVAIAASRCVGMSDGSGTISAAKILWSIGAASRFPTFGCLVRYCRLAPENGKAPGRAKGHRIHYNPAAWQALFDLSETWNRMPDSCWRIMWDAFKIQLAEQHPDYPKGRIHNMARRKVLREFLRELYDTWLAWEARQ